MENKDSPCIEICIMDEGNDLCTGYYRNIDEITNWVNYSSHEREEILKEIEERKIKYQS